MGHNKTNQSDTEHFLTRIVWPMNTPYIYELEPVHADLMYEWHSLKDVRIGDRSYKTGGNVGTSGCFYYMTFENGVPTVRFLTRDNDNVLVFVVCEDTHLPESIHTLTAESTSEILKTLGSVYLIEIATVWMTINKISPDTFDLSSFSFLKATQYFILIAF